MKEIRIIGSILILLLSGCSSKLDSLNLKDNQNDKYVFLKKMNLKSAEIIFEIRDNKIKVLDIGRGFTLNELNNYKKNNKNTSCLLISTKRHRPCSISKNDNIFYKKEFSFSDSIVTSLIGVPLSLVEDALGILILRKPKTTINTIKNGYTNELIDNKNINILGNKIEMILLQEKSFKKLSNSEIFSYFNNCTIIHKSGEIEYHSPNYTTYYYRKNKDITKGVWNIIDNKVCYKYMFSSTKYCHNTYSYKNKYMDSNLNQMSKENLDVKSLKIKYTNMILEKEKRIQKKIEEKKLAQKEKNRKINNAKKNIGQTVVWYDTHKIYDEKGIFFNLIRMWTTYKYKYTGILQDVDASSVKIKVTSIKLSIPALVSIDYLKYKYKAIEWGNSQIGAIKRVSLNSNIKVIN